jgi:hypothetical protein
LMSRETSRAIWPRTGKGLAGRLVVETDISDSGFTRA